MIPSGGDHLTAERALQRNRKPILAELFMRKLLTLNAGSGARSQLPSCLPNKTLNQARWPVGHRPRCLC